MNFTQGDVYMVTSNVTPVFNDQHGHIQNQKIDIRTGVNGLSDIGKVKYVNNRPYINREKQFLNGVTYNSTSSVFISPQGGNTNDRYTESKKIIDLYNGMQIMPLS